MKHRFAITAIVAYDRIFDAFSPSLFLCKMILMWVHCAEILTRPVLPLTYSANPAFSEHYRESRQRFLSFIHPAEAAHTFFFSSLPHAGAAYFVFVFLPRCLSVGVVVDDINRAPFLLGSTILRTTEESLEDTRITTESSAREFSVLVLDGTARF